MKTKKGKSLMKRIPKITSSLLALALFIFIAGGTATAASIDGGYPTASGNGYTLGVSDENKELMLMHITNIDMVKQPGVPKEAYAKANNIASQINKMENRIISDFQNYFGNNPGEFERKIDTQIKTLEAFGFLGFDIYGPSAPNTLRFSTPKNT